MTKNIKFVITRFVFFKLKMHQNRGSDPDPAGELTVPAGDAPPDPLVGWGGRYYLPIPLPLDAFGVSIGSQAP